MKIKTKGGKNNYCVTTTITGPMFCFVFFLYPNQLCKRENLYLDTEHIHVYHGLVIMCLIIFVNINDDIIPILNIILLCLLTVFCYSFLMQESCNSLLAFSS